MFRCSDRILNLSDSFWSYTGDDALLRTVFGVGLTWISASTCLMRIQVGPWCNILTLFYCFVDLSSLWGKWKRKSPLNIFCGGSRPWAPVAMESSQLGLPPCHTLMIASPVFVTTPMPQPEPIPKMAAMLQPESAPKITARPQPEPPPARAASSPAISSAKVATSPVWFATPEPPAIMKATPRSSATMDDTPEFPVVMDVNQSSLSSAVLYLETIRLSLGVWNWASSLADPPLRSVRAAGIPRPSAVEVLEVVPLPAVLPVMAVAMLRVWAVHCTLTPEPSPVQVSVPEPSPVQESIPEQVQFKFLFLSQVQSENPFRSQVQFKFLFLSQVQSENPFRSQVQFKSLVLSQVQYKTLFPNQVRSLNPIQTQFHSGRRSSRIHLNHHVLRPDRHRSHLRHLLVKQLH